MAAREAAPPNPIAGTKRDWLDQVLADHDLPTAAFKVAYLLVQRYMNNKSGACYPSQELLAADTGLSERQIRTLLGDLAQRGHLRIIRNGKRVANDYEMVLGDRKKTAAHDDEVTGSFTSGDRKFSAAMTGRKLPPNPLSEPSEEPHAVGVGGVRSTIDVEGARDARAPSLEHYILIVGFGVCSRVLEMNGAILVRSVRGQGKAPFEDDRIVPVEEDDLLLFAADSDGHPTPSSARIMERLDLTPFKDRAYRLAYYAGALTSITETMVERRLAALRNYAAIGIRPH